MPKNSHKEFLPEICKGLLNFNNIKMHKLITNVPNISIDNFPRKEINIESEEINTPCERSLGNEE